MCSKATLYPLTTDKGKRWNRMKVIEGKQEARQSSPCSADALRRYIRLGRQDHSGIPVLRRVRHCNHQVQTTRPVGNILLGHILRNTSEYDNNHSINLLHCAGYLQRSLHCVAPDSSFPGESYPVGENVDSVFWTFWTYARVQSRPHRVHFEAKGACGRGISSRPATREHYVSHRSSRKYPM